MAVEIVGDFENISTTIKSSSADKLKAAADFIVQRAQEMCPVDTGALRDSITAGEVADDGDTLSLDVTAGDDTVDYAAYVELGTYKMGAQPYLGPAYEEGRAQLESSLGEIIPS